MLSGVVHERCKDARKCRAPALALWPNKMKINAFMAVPFAKPQKGTGDRPSLCQSLGSRGLPGFCPAVHSQGFIPHERPLSDQRLACKTGTLATNSMSMMHETCHARNCRGGADFRRGPFRFRKPVRVCRTAKCSMNGQSTRLIEAVSLMVPFSADKFPVKHACDEPR